MNCLARTGVCILPALKDGNVFVKTDASIFLALNSGSIFPDKILTMLLVNYFLTLYDSLSIIIF